MAIFRWSVAHFVLNFCQLASFFMDATRISDGASVALKSIKPSVHPYEVEIGTYLSSEPLASDPKTIASRRSARCARCGRRGHPGNAVFEKMQTLPSADFRRERGLFSANF